MEQTELYPQFATHNAHTVAWLLEVGAERPFELQRLHGMGEELYGALLERPGFARRCRVYAPVGSHEHLLPYLVRRLLENGANTSFVNRLVDAAARVDEIVAAAPSKSCARCRRSLILASRYRERCIGPSATTHAARISRRCATSRRSRWGSARAPSAGGARGLASTAPTFPARSSNVAIRPIAAA